MVKQGIEVQSGVVMAVKKLRPIIGEQDKQFKNEADHLAKVNHNNIVKLIGYCDETKEGPVYDEYQQKYIVAEMQHKLLCYEYLSNGSLDNIIFGNMIVLHPHLARLTFCIPFLLVLRLYMYIFCRPVTWT